MQSMRNLCGGKSFPQALLISFNKMIRSKDNEKQNKWIKGFLHPVEYPEFVTAGERNDRICADIMAV